MKFLVDNQLPAAIVPAIQDYRTMNTSTPKKTDLEIPPRPFPSQTKRPYSTPRLTCYGDVRTMTMGGSPGITDSGTPGTQKPPP